MSVFPPIPPTGEECPPECFPDDDSDRHQHCPQDAQVAALLAAAQREPGFDPDTFMAEFDDSASCHDRGETY